MTEETKALIVHRLQRAHEAVEEAVVLLEHKHLSAYVNRLYYASFYAVSALLMTKGLSSAKHSGVRALFHQNFVKSGIIKSELGEFYDTLFRNRQKADYADFVEFQIDDVQPWLDGTKRFVEFIENIAKKQMSGQAT